MAGSGARPEVVLGIDEAGYGPLLGPLVVGAVTLECERYDALAIWRALGPRSGVADSKAVFSHRAMGPGEATVLALLSLAGVRPVTRAELLDAVLVDAQGALAPFSTGVEVLGPVDEAPCRAGTGLLACTADRAPLPRWVSEHPAGRAQDLAARLATAGVRIASARAIALCPGRLNRAFDAGISKGLVDFWLFGAHLERAAREAARRRLTAHCGKLGGRSRYGDLLADLGLTAVVEESPARSAYEVSGVGRVEFLRKAESQHPAVAMASMVAKLVREHLLDQWHAMLAAASDRPLEPASGYHEPATLRYVEETAPARRLLGVPDRCFLRGR